jgi:hypothetical protein
VTGQNGVRAKVAAVDQVGAAVELFSRRADQASEQAITGARKCEQQVAEEHERRVRELKQARMAREAAAAALRGCTENCAPLQAALTHAVEAEAGATERADASAKCVAQVGEAIRRFGSSQRSFETILREHAARAVGSTRQLSSHLQNYLGSDGSRSTHGSGTGQQGAGVASRSSSASRSVEDVDVRKVIDDRTGELSFEKVTRDDVAWGLDQLKTVVEPALEMGKGADYFASRDKAEGLSGERSYSGVYNWFYNSDHAIKLTRASGGYVVSNGYHRLAVARELGIHNLPAVVT